MLLQKREPLPVDSRSSTRQSSSLPFNLHRETRSSTRRQTNSCTNRETRSFTCRQLLARERRSRRAQIVRENRTARKIAHADVNLVQHFNRMRNRPQRLPSNNGMSDDEDSDSDETPHGIQEFNSAAASFPSTPYMYIVLQSKHASWIQLRLPSL